MAPLNKRQKHLLSIRNTVSTKPKTHNQSDDTYQMMEDSEESEDEDMDNEEKINAVMKRVKAITDSEWKNGAGDYLKIANRHGAGDSARNLRRKKPPGGSQTILHYWN
jgi:hypothetical protein